ncbi:hypothetical protein [Lacrimispora sp. 38-1]|uniref:hypothetical protein n=1 Tax=Lacrimispora sp. 38-1 TaxID=3125778 RepID=UPI003CF913A4
MEIKTLANDTINSLNTIFEKHKEDRICILATTCCGKSTLHEQIPGTVDMDNELWPQLTKEEEAYICQKPWTKEIGDFAGRLVRERVTVKAGYPLFTLILLDCEVIVYLDISDELLAEHCKKRGAAFRDAKNVKDAIENTWNKQREKGDKICYYLKVTE